MLIVIVAWAIAGSLLPAAAPLESPLSVRYVIAGKLLDKGAYADAVAAYEMILSSEREITDHLRSRVLNNIGFAYYKLNKRAEAREYYDQALKVDPNYATCLNNLAVLLINERNFSAALPLLEHSYKVERTAKVAFNLFAAHYYLSNRNRALAFVEEAFRLDERYTEARLKAKNIKQGDIDRLKKRIR